MGRASPRSRLGGATRRLVQAAGTSLFSPRSSAQVYRPHVLSTRRDLTVETIGELIETRETAATF
jgi:hypothetical protein